MGQWQYEWELCGRAHQDTREQLLGKIPWRLSLLVGAMVAGALETGIRAWVTGNPSPSWWWLLEALAVGIVALAVAAVLVWIGNLVRAPYLRDLEQREEITKLRVRLNPDLQVVATGGPIPFKAKSQRFLIFPLTVRNGAETPISIMVRLQAEFLTGLNFVVLPEASPMRAWEKGQEELPGGPLQALPMPMDLAAYQSARGYIGFDFPEILQGIASVRRILRASLELEDLSTRRRLLIWQGMVSLEGLGLAAERPSTPPAVPQRSTPDS